jgi:hypothetical protein
MQNQKTHHKGFHLLRKIHPRSDRSLPQLRSRHRLHNAYRSLFHCISPSQTYGENHDTLQAVPQLRSHTPRCHPHLQKQRHGTSRTQRRLIPQRIQSTKPSRWTFLPSLDTENPINNGAVLNIAQLSKAVTSSAAEAELGTLYINACKAVPQCQTLAEMGHKQPPTPMQTNNSTALGVVNNNIQSQRTEAMDMQFHWLRCCEAQHQFRFFWCPGTTNRADYWTKHHCTAHHIKKHPKILTPTIVLGALRASAKRTPDSKTTAQPTQTTRAATAA